MSSLVRVFAAVFFAGVVSLLLELSLLREFVYIFGSTARSNALIISIFLLGLVAGSYAGTVRLFQCSAQEARARFFDLQVLNILFIIFLYATKWYFVYHCPNQAAVYGYFLLTVFFPSFLSGLGYAFIVKVLHREGETRIVWLYGISTLGSVIGGLAHGLWIVPVWGMKAAYIAAVLCAAAAAGSIMTGIGRRQLLTAGLTSLVVVAIVLDPFKTVLYSSRVLFAQDSEFGIVEVWHMTDKTARRNHERLSMGSRLYEQVEQPIDMRVNNVHQAYNLPVDRRIHEDWARTSLEITGDRSKVLLLGYGSGVTAEAYLRWSALDRLDIIENCDPIISAGRKFFPMEYERVMSDPRARMIVDDFRGYVRFTKEKYDVIALDHSIQDPYQIGYFTTDFFDRLKEILTERGVVILLGQGLSWNTTRVSFPYIYRVTAQNVESYLNSNCLYMTMQSLRPQVSGDYAIVDDPVIVGGAVYSDDRVWKISSK